MRQQVSARLQKLSAQAIRAAGSQDERSIHDFRVSIRRFSQGLIMFPGLFPKKERKAVRARLKKMMNLTSEVRNRDIALEHLQGSDDEPVKTRLQNERAAHAGKFKQAVQELVTEDFANEWKSALRLDV